MPSQNVLHQYRSYAYHHILLVADSSNTALALASSPDIANFQHPRDGSPRFTPKTIGGGRYIVLIDGTTDASLYIERASWEAVLAAGNKQSDGRVFSGSNELTASVTIVEMNGATFFNLIASLSKVLGSSAQQTYFVIKTIFVGYTDDGELEPITNIDPFIGGLLDSQAEFGTAGATYTLSFSGMTNGMGHQPNFSMIAGSTVRIGEDIKSIGDGIKQTINSINNLETKLYNENKVKYAEEQTAKQENETDEQRKAKIASFDFTDYEKRVQRTIFEPEIDPTYFDPAYEIQPQRISSVDSKAWYLEMNRENKITDMVFAMFAHCEKAQTERFDKKERYMFDVDVVLTSQPNHSILLYKVKVTRKRVMLMTTDDQGVPSPNPGDVEFLDLNYIFTGKNIDILDFNMSMQFGLSFMEAANVIPSIPKPNTNASDGTGVVVPMGGNSAIPAESGDIPPMVRNVAKSLSSNSFIADVRNPALISQYYAALAQHSAVETLLVKIKIHGNPRFLNNAGSSAGSPFEYVRVNVRMPDPTNPEAAPIPFWYQGLYRVLSYVNEFEQGMFTQTIELNSIPNMDRSGQPTSPGSAIAHTQTATSAAAAARPPIANPSDFNPSEAKQMQKIKTPSLDERSASDTINDLIQE